MSMSSESRPNPEDLLAKARLEDAYHPRGKLKLFFGAAAGVGKTFSMLEAARQRKNEGVDVVRRQGRWHSMPVYPVGPS